MAAIFNNDMMQAFHENEPQAIRLIFSEHYSSMVSYAQQLINDRSEAEELVVNTFIKLIAMRRNFRTVADIKAFLLVTVRNACYDYLSCLDMEQPAKADLLSLSELVPSDKEGNPVPFTTEMLLALYEGMQQLTALCSEVFQLYFYNKMTTADIAAQLGLPLKTVKVQKEKAIQLLRASLPLTITPFLN